MTGAPKKLSATQHQAVIAIISHNTLKSAAESVGVSVRTLNRWMLNPLFAGKLKQAENQLIESGIRQLMLLQGDAINTLAELLNCEDDLVRRQAAVSVLSQLIKLRELYKIEEKLNEIEDEINAKELSQSYS